MDGGDRVLAPAWSGKLRNNELKCTAQESTGIRLYFPMLLGSIVTNSEQLWFPKHIVQCSTSHVGSTFRQVSHIRPSARISVQAWHSFCDTARGFGFPVNIDARSLLIALTSGAASSSTASPRT